jgi:hypothetical protein
VVEFHSKQYYFKDNKDNFSTLKFAKVGVEFRTVFKLSSRKIQNFKILPIALREFFSAKKKKISFLERFFVF